MALKIPFGVALSGPPIRLTAFSNISCNSLVHFNLSFDELLDRPEPMLQWDGLVTLPGKWHEFRYSIVRLLKERKINIKPVDRKIQSMVTKRNGWMLRCHKMFCSCPSKPSKAEKSEDSQIPYHFSSCLHHLVKKPKNITGTSSNQQQLTLAICCFPT